MKNKWTIKFFLCKKIIIGELLQADKYTIKFKNINS